MTAWAAKRFWTDVSVVAQDGGFAVKLDGRAVRTPAKTELIVPSAALAEAIAEEWRAVEGAIDPEVMPFTRSANAALDKVAVQFDEVVAMLGAYGGSDLLCYRAAAPAELVARQAEMWDPILDWAADTFGARLAVTSGLMPVDQPAHAVAALTQPLKEATAFELTALHDLIALSGSLVLALRVAREASSPQQAWDLSRLDETWQAEQWGVDEEAEEAAAIKQAAFDHAARFYKMM